MKSLFLFLFVPIALIAQMSPDAALRKLKTGNQRYVSESLEHPRRDLERRASLNESQAPFAVIVSCADSRVGPEIIFDQGIGDLFVVRVAGNVIGNLELESINYAAKYLKSSIIIVIGHENCGAVNAVIQGATKDIKSIASLIKPAVKEAKKSKGDNLLYQATIDNAKNMAEYLLKTPIVSGLVKENQLMVVSGYYNLESGKVDFFTH